MSERCLKRHHLCCLDLRYINKSPIPYLFRLDMRDINSNPTHPVYFCSKSPGKYVIISAILKQALLRLERWPSSQEMLF